AADMLLEGDGADLVVGNRGDDVASLGAGDDVFVWNPGDGNDIVEGQAGFDRMLFNGANIAEKIDISANGPRVRFTRDIATVTMDLNGVEGIDFNAKGGADTITVNALSGTGVPQVNLDLAGTPGSGIGDGAADSVIVNGTAGADVIGIASANGEVVVSGLAAQVRFKGIDAGTDRLEVNG